MRRLALILGCVLLVAGCGHQTARLWVSSPRAFSACVSADCGPWSATLNWQIPSFPGQTGYWLFLNGTKVGSASSSPFVFRGIDCGTTDTLGVEAHDASGGHGPLWTVSHDSPACTDPAKIHVAQTAAGTGDGSSCSNAEAVSVLSTSTDWTAGNVIGLCGTITSPITAQGSGTAGSPITVYWEPGATLSAPTWHGTDSSGAAVVAHGSYLTFDGGNNGVSIQATAEGSGLGDQGVSPDIGIDAGAANNSTSCNHCTFENLTIANLYQHTALTDETVDATAVNAIKFSGSNITIADNTIHDVGWALYAVWANGSANNEVYGNNVYNSEHGFASTSLFPNGSIGPLYVFDNHFHDWAIWDTTPNAPYHHDGIHCFTSDGTTGASTYNGFYIYDNRFDGTIGTHADFNQDTFMEGGSQSGATPCASSSSTGMYLFNNVMTSTDAVPDNAYMGLGSTSGGGAFNNTVVGYSTGSGSCSGYSYQQAGSTMGFEDNLLSTCGTLMGQSGNGSATIGDFSSGSPDYNSYVNGGSNAFVCEATQGGTTNYYNFSQFSSWKSCLTSSGQAPGGDAHSQTLTSVQANFNTDGSLGTGSLAIGAGTNLTSVCNSLPSSPVNVGTALCTTYTGPPVNGTAGSSTTGTARPSTGAWDAGAF